MLLQPCRERSSNLHFLFWLPYLLKKFFTHDLNRTKSRKNVCVMLSFGGGLTSDFFKNNYRQPFIFLIWQSICLVISLKYISKMCLGTINLHQCTQKRFCVICNCFNHSDVSINVWAWIVQRIHLIASYK